MATDMIDRLAPDAVEVTLGNRYPISLYLNQQYVYNILAMMEDGFSSLETIKTANNASNEKSYSVPQKLDHERARFKVRSEA